MLHVPSLWKKKFAKQIDEVGGKTHIKLGICTLTNKLCQKS